MCHHRNLFFIETQFHGVVVSAPSVLGRTTQWRAIDYQRPRLLSVRPGASNGVKDSFNVIAAPGQAHSYWLNIRVKYECYVRSCSSSQWGGWYAGTGKNDLVYPHHTVPF